MTSSFSFPLIHRIYLKIHCQQPVREVRRDAGLPEVWRVFSHLRELFLSVLSLQIFNWNLVFLDVGGSKTVPICDGSSNASDHDLRKGLMIYAIREPRSFTRTRRIMNPDLYVGASLAMKMLAPIVPPRSYETQTSTSCS